MSISKKVGESVPLSFPTPFVPFQFTAHQKQRSYEKVAKMLGFNPPELIRIRLLWFFEDEGIKTYNYEDVCAWMVEKKANIRVNNWCWRALREKDVIHGCEWGVEHSEDRYRDGAYSANSIGGLDCSPYDRLIPIHVLEKIVKIYAKFGDDVKFLVSDYANSEVGTFILVRPSTANSDDLSKYNLIFDTWHESDIEI